MAKPAFAALSALLLAACGGPEQPSAQNGATAAEPGAVENSTLSEPASPGAPANQSADPVPPPDAVSHPDGYLPPAPGEPEPESNAGSPAADPSPPATEDEYIRNKQAGR